jgi:hypothetical protein
MASPGALAGWILRASPLQLQQLQVNLEFNNNNNNKAQSNSNHHNQQPTIHSTQRSARRAAGVLPRDSSPVVATAISN